MRQVDETSMGASLKIIAAAASKSSRCTQDIKRKAPRVKEWRNIWKYIQLYYTLGMWAWKEMPKELMVDQACAISEGSRRRVGRSFRICDRTEALWTVLRHLGSRLALSLALPMLPAAATSWQQDLIITSSSSLILISPMFTPIINQRLKQLEYGIIPYHDQLISTRCSVLSFFKFSPPASRVRVSLVHRFRQCAESHAFPHLKQSQPDTFGIIWVWVNVKRLQSWIGECPNTNINTIQYS